MPVIGRGDGHRFNILVGEDLTHIFKLFGLFNAVADEGGLRLLTRRLIDVAQGDDARFREFRIDTEMVAAAAAESDDSDVDALVGTPYSHR